MEFLHHFYFASTRVIFIHLDSRGNEQIITTTTTSPQFCGEIMVNFDDFLESFRVDE